MDRIRNDECGMRNDEWKASCLPFIIPHSAFIICLSSGPSLLIFLTPAQTREASARGTVSPARRGSVNREILRLFVVDDDGGGGLFGHELEFFAQLDINARRREQLEELRLVFEVRAGGIAEAEARGLVALMKEPGEFFRVSVCDAEFLADALVPEFGERLGWLHREAVKVEGGRGIGR